MRSRSRTGRGSYLVCSIGTREYSDSLCRLQLISVVSGWLLAPSRPTSTAVSSPAGGVMLVAITTSLLTPPAPRQFIDRISPGLFYDDNHDALDYVHGRPLRARHLAPT